ncbi:unnamed protein product [Diabrotica balteata]|uniref:Uncharacterized protein n=1 Tax=Diabrotica balteata TaxID=107213 RepID=A0A9N9T2V1_DIABA|nr:unnamed protein product [Diabrotica balteata]
MENNFERVAIDDILFSGFWSRRLREGDLSTPWIFGGVHSSNLPPTTPKELLFSEESYFQQIVSDNMENDLREILREKAEKHRDYYNSLVGTDITKSSSSPSDHTMEVEVPIAALNEPVTTELPERSSTGSTTTKPRQRRRGVYEIEGMLPEPTEFKSVKLLRENYIAMLEKTSKQLSRVSESRDENSEISDEKPEILNEKSELLVPPSSGYSSSTASGASDDEREKNWRKIERRSGSSDSAVQSDEEGPIQSNWGEKKEEIFPIDGYQPRSPYSPRCSVDHSNVPSKTIIEAHYVPLPLDRKFSVDVISENNSDNFDTFDESRRHSCFSEGAEDQPRYRYWRTPSVVVSDYSDDIMGLTLEDIEYIRSRRDNSISPDSSLHSSCSNLNFCGSTLSGLDGDYVLCQPYRKSSNCSTCSTLSDEEESPVGDTLLQPHKNRETRSSAGRSSSGNEAGPSGVNKKRMRHSQKLSKYERKRTLKDDELLHILEPEEEDKYMSEGSSGEEYSDNGDEWCTDDDYKLKHLTEELANQTTPQVEMPGATASGRNSPTWVDIEELQKFEFRHSCQTSTVTFRFLSENIKQKS